MKPQNLAISLLRMDLGTQNRLKINEETVADYEEKTKDSDEWPFPPLDVFHDGTDATNYLVADGFHRLLGALRAKRAEVPCIVHPGTATDARIFGMTANDRHGLRMTRADKRACIEWLLDNGGKLTQAEIAEKAGVSVRLVKSIVTERNPLLLAAKVQFAPLPPMEGDSGEATPLDLDFASSPSSGGSAWAIEGLTKAAQAIAQKATDSEVKTLARLTEAQQDKVARLVRVGQANTISQAMAKAKIKPPPKPRGAAGIKVVEGDEEPDEAQIARETIGGWAETVGRFLSRSPSVDDYRAKWPGKQAEAALAAVKTCYESLKAWQKCIK